MTQHVVWYTIRASGIVTWALVTASVLWGLLLASHSTRRPRPAWVLDLHRFLSGLALAFLALHLGALLADSFIGFTPAALVVPFASRWRPAAVAWGIVACDLLVVVEITSVLMARLSRRLWHATHLLSFVVFATATVHGLTAGTDAGGVAVRACAFGSIAAVAALAGFRLVARRRHLHWRRGLEQASARPRAMVDPRAEPSEHATMRTARTLRPVQDAIAEVRRGAARGGRVARRGDDRVGLSSRARR